MPKILKLAKAMSWITQLTIGLLIFSFGYVWTDKSLRAEVLADYLIGIDQADLSPNATYAGFGLSAIVFCVLIYGLYQCLQFFQLYRKNEMFPEKSGQHLSHFGLALLALGPITIAIRSISSVLFSIHLPQGQRQLVLQVDGTDILLIVVGGLIFMTGHILNAARHIAEENKQII